MRAVALSLVLSLFTVGCFKNPQHRTIAKVGEGVAIIAGIALLAAVNTGADCEDSGRMVDQDCKDKAELLSNIGLGLILAGMIGFVVTVSTSPDDDASTAPTTAPKPTSDNPPGPATPAPTEPTPTTPTPTPDAGSGAGSAAPPATP